MHRKPYRFGLLIIGLLVTAALGYRAVEDEASLGRASREGVALDRAADQALESLLNLRASLHAYVAPGQGVPFWSQRSQQSIDTLREQLVALDAALAQRGGSLAETLDTVDQLAAAERRTREYARRGEALLAGDIVFTEVRDLMSASFDQILAARNTLAASQEARIAAIRREQAMIAAGAVLTWLVIALIFVPPAKEVAAKDPNEWRNDLAVTIKKQIPKDAAPSKKPMEPLEALEPVAPVPPRPVGLPVSALQLVSEICSDLSALADLGALTGALRGAADALDASGIIVWLAANDGSTLSPVASHGFDEKLVARIGRIPSESANLTAAAYRDNVPRISSQTDTAPAAVAVAMCSPSGPVGVLSVELKPGVAADEARVALTMIFAAQLATLAQPISDAPQTSASVRVDSDELQPDAADNATEAPDAPQARVAL